MPSQAEPLTPLRSPARCPIPQTLSRIGNWQEMDDLERARVLRVLGKRNEIRLTGLRAEAAAQAQASAGQEQAGEK